MPTDALLYPLIFAWYALVLETKDWKQTQPEVTSIMPRALYLYIFQYVRSCGCELAEADSADFILARCATTCVHTLTPLCTLMFVPPDGTLVLLYHGLFRTDSSATMSPVQVIIGDVTVQQGWVVRQADVTVHDDRRNRYCTGRYPANRSLHQFVLEMRRSCLTIFFVICGRNSVQGIFCSVGVEWREEIFPHSDDG